MSRDQAFLDAARALGYSFEGEIKRGGNYLPLVRVGDTIYVSGQVPRVGDVVVLDPCEVPHEPGDGVRVVVEPGVEVLGREALDRGVYRFMNAFERIDENA